MPLKPTIVIVLLTLGKISFGQNYHHNVFWLRLALSDTINQKTRVELFLQKRTQGTAGEKGNVFKSSQFNSIWFWLHFNVSKTSRISFSPIGYFESYILNAKPLDENIPPIKEYRMSLRYTNEQKWRVVNYSNRYSFEYRLRDLQNNGVYRPNFRVRYMAKLEKPVYGLLSQEKPVTFELNDEVFLQFGDAVHNNPNVFDQNRIYLGFNYEWFRNFKTSLGYIYGFQERNSGDEFDNTNTFWLVLTFENLFTQFKRRK